MSDTTYVLNPAVKIISTQDDKVELFLIGTNKKIMATSQILKILDFFRITRSINEVNQIDDKILNFLFSENLLIKNNTLNYYKYGLVKPDMNPIGFSANINNIENKHNHESPWCVLGAPFAFDSPVGTDASTGPAAIRNTLKMFSSEKLLHDGQINKEHVIFDWNRKKEYLSYLVLPKDLGNIIFNNREETFKDTQDKIAYTTYQVLNKGFKPLILGGDHSISKPIIDSILKKYKRINIIHFDAHTDRYSEKIINKFMLTRGNVFSEIVKHSRVESLYQIGIREYEPGVIKRDSSSSKVKVISSRELNDLSFTNLFDEIPKDIPVYLSIDADVFDPVIAPEVSFPVMGGLTFYQMYELINHITSHFEIAGADFVEVSGPEKGKNLAASCIGNLITLLLLNLGGNSSHEKRNET
ncbi:arginase family protein [Oceanobacillus massiliensis]|uniref:arginase family protein n=1 Tax=Oceanobacillus massiliensis TaxID=1465765 RepID=UPI0002894744|nr:arginase family protein [Oceanobacillus massiliensis]